MKPHLFGVPLTRPYSKIAGLPLARMAQRSRGGVIFKAEPWHYVVETVDAPLLIARGHLPLDAPRVQVLVRALGYTLRELVCFRGEGDVWILDLGPQHGGGVPQHVRFGEPGSGADFVAAGISGLDEVAAIEVAIGLVGGAS